MKGKDIMMGVQLEQSLIPHSQEIKRAGESDLGTSNPSRECP
jgi:hypothetical protein